jgi:molybdate-binding protein/DNA-binding transcriptional regulator YhcF (GntR family)
MEKTPLYKKISEEIRQDILEGRLQPGDPLPSVREMTRKWDCTSGTAQHAYADLAREGLLVSQPGKGTRVSSQLDLRAYQGRSPLRLANMVHRAESFLLDSITAGYSLAEVQSSMNIAMDRWRELQHQAADVQDTRVLRFTGSHDMAMLWLSNHMGSIVPGVSLQLTFAGSLRGLMLLAEGQSDLAGCHLWDEESQCYNEPFIHRLFPGEKMALIHLANRKIGLIVSPGNPLRLDGIADLLRPGLRFVNRQAGSGTRVWLDTAFDKLGLDPRRIQGYTIEKATHSQVAQEIAEGRADAGVGLESAAASLKLGFVPLVDECYDLAAYARLVEAEPLATLVGWLGSAQAREQLSFIVGYDLREMGKVRIVS